MPSMTGDTSLTRGERGQLAYAIMHFARVLRAAGLRIGSERVLRSVRAIQAVGVEDRGAFYWALHAVLVSEREQHRLFDQAFDLFWRPMWEMHGEIGRDADRSNGGPASLMVRFGGCAASSDVDGVAGRAAWRQARGDGALSASERELLQTKHFDKMSVEELALAKEAIARMPLPANVVPTRRFEAYSHGARVDLRKTLRLTARSGVDAIPLARMRRTYRPANVVLLCDISGSMNHYARMLLHFAHALVTQRRHVSTFVFATRLTNITRQLRHKDVERALEQAARAVRDWSGGTRIGSALHCFNTEWSRRVLAQGAVVLLITDGLDRDAGAGIAPEMERLRKSCRRLVWLNPLLRYTGFELRSRGMRAILPHVDKLHPVHNLQSIAALPGILDGAHVGQ